LFHGVLPMHWCMCKIYKSFIKSCTDYTRQTVACQPEISLKNLCKFVSL
jgi:hypothetical protein